MHLQIPPYLALDNIGRVLFHHNLAIGQISDQGFTFHSKYKFMSWVLCVELVLGESDFSILTAVEVEDDVEVLLSAQPDIVVVPMVSRREEGHVVTWVLRKNIRASEAILIE